MKQNCVKRVPSDAVNVLGVWKVQLLAARPDVPDVTKGSTDDVVEVAEDDGCSDCVGCPDCVGCSV